MDDDLADKHERVREARLESVKRWVNYIQKNSPEVWGAQQNALVNSVLQSARKSSLSPEHQRQIRAFAEGDSEESGVDTSSE